VILPTGLQYKFAVPPYVQLLVPHIDIMCCSSEDNLHVNTGDNFFSSFL